LSVVGVRCFPTGGCNGGRLKWVCARMRCMQSKLLPACSRYGTQGFCDELMLWIMLCADAMPDPLCIYASLRHAEALLHALATFAAPAAVCIAPVASCQACSPCALRMSQTRQCPRTREACVQLLGCVSAPRWRTSCCVNPIAGGF
jgi:hypothetical protein